ncbi:Gfo/Idh/MocA family protein [Shouchella shacheensis]|uniref:Gfo/Idh/MocA family protein n=1 Tax=Shouchella shacheensis TaxID=1649580 RepID=UPI0007402B52|nr:Gfo/Idh/MocA family oxidoreductase [Shouchella shacheensis]
MKVGVIGTGNMGENHVRTYKSLSDICQLVGVYDVNEIKGKEIASKYNVKLFQSLEDLLSEVDAVSITVPTMLHYEVGLTCIKHTVHMLMEKPIASTVNQAKTLVQKANDTGVKIQVGHIELFNPLIQALKKELKNEKVIAIETHRMTPTKLREIDVVHDLMIHDLYILTELLDDELSELYTLGKLTDTSPTHATVIANSTKGVVVQLTASFKSNKRIRSIQVLTENKYIMADLLQMELSVTHAPREGEFHRSVMERVHIPAFTQPLALQLTDFLTCVKNGQVPTVAGEDGIQALILTSKISENIINHS